MNRREEGKADRRRRITGAARDLIRETGDTGLSMRAIAARAQVSLSTPYNLFGSKRAIVLAVLEDIREFHERFSRLHPVSAIDRLFQAVSISTSYYAEDQAFYRTLWTALLDTGGKDDRTALLTPQREAFWRSLVSEAVREGALIPEIDVDLMTRNLDLTFGAVMLSWVFGGVRAEELEPTIAYGYALALGGAATEAWRPRLAKKIAEYQKTLARLRRVATAA
ncbi:MAG TPA: TetR/AcrR family transcriptional regulator [Caulobacteraceae bacterium]